MDIMVTLAAGPKSPTRLMYTTNLSWAPLQECLTALINQGLVQESKQSFRRRRYALTEKGKYVVSRYADFMKDLGPAAGEQIKELQ